MEKEEKRYYFVSPPPLRFPLVFGFYTTMMYFMPALFVSLLLLLVTHFAATDAFALDSHPPHAFKDDLSERHRLHHLSRSLPGKARKKSIDGATSN